jgi:hypothetical protein
MPPPIPADQAFIGDRRGRRRYEQGQIQGLDGTQPILPLRQGILEQQTYDYIRHGTTGLFAALEVATGKVTADSWWRDVRHGERAKRVTDPFTAE